MATYGMLRRPTDLSRIKAPSEPFLSARLDPGARMLRRKPDFSNVKSSASTKPSGGGGGGGDMSFLYRPAPADAPSGGVGKGLRRRMMSRS